MQLVLCDVWASHSSHTRSRTYKQNSNPIYEWFNLFLAISLRCRDRCDVYSLGWLPVMPLKWKQKKVESSTRRYREKSQLISIRSNSKHLHYSYIMAESRSTAHGKRNRQATIAKCTHTHGTLCTRQTKSFGRFRLCSFYLVFMAVFAICLSNDGRCATNVIIWQINRQINNFFIAFALLLSRHQMPNAVARQWCDDGKAFKCQICAWHKFHARLSAIYL